MTVQALACDRPDDAEVLHDHLRPDGQPLERVLTTDLVQLVLLTANQEEALEVPTVRLQEERLDGRDPSLDDQARQETQRLAEQLHRFAFAPGRRRAPADEQR